MEPVQASSCDRHRHAISCVIQASSQPSPILDCNDCGSVSFFGPRAVTSRHGEYRLFALGTTSWRSSPGPVASTFDLKELHFNARNTYHRASWSRLSCQIRISLARIAGCILAINARYNCWPYAPHASFGSHRRKSQAGGTASTARAGMPASKSIYIIG